MAAGVPLHGKNLLPGDDVLPGFRQTILDWMAEVTALRHRVMQSIARSPDLPADYFARRYTADPLILSRIFNYPEPANPGGARRAPRRRRAHRLRLPHAPAPG